jgi:hypothetical protein
MTPLFEISNYDCRLPIYGSATAFFTKRLTPPEFQQSEIKNQKTKIHCAGGAA